MSFSTKKTWVSTYGWRGYERPVWAVCGANDTGTWSDSPCRSEVCKMELRQAQSLLKKAGINTRMVTTRSSNVFCVHRYLIAEVGTDLQAAADVIRDLVDECSLLYVA